MEVDSESRIILKKYGLLPAPEHELLLKAALLTGKPAIDNWKSWRAITDIETLDHTSNRLLPALYYNLQENGVNDPIMDRYKGTTRKTWYKNQMLLAELGKFVKHLQEENLEIVVLKGAAMLLKYYPNYGLRPMADLDMLVHENDVDQSITKLSVLGWESVPYQVYQSNDPQFFKREEVASKFFKTRGSCGFRNENKTEMDLHTHVFPERNSTKLSQEFWDRAETIELANGTKVLSLSATDTLLHTLVHGLIGGSILNARWITDSSYIIRSKQVDWRLLLETSKRYELTAFVKYGVSYLKELLNIDVPQELLDAKVSAIEMEKFQNGNLQTDKLTNIKSFWTDYSRIYNSRSLLKRIVLFPEFLRVKYLLIHFWQLPLFLLYKGLKPKKS